MPTLLGFGEVYLGLACKDDVTCLRMYISMVLCSLLTFSEVSGEHVITRWHLQFKITHTSMKTFNSGLYDSVSVTLSASGGKASRWWTVTLTFHCPSRMTVPTCGTHVHTLRETLGAHINHRGLSEQRAVNSCSTRLNLTSNYGAVLESNAGWLSGRTMFVKTAENNPSLRSF